MTNTPAKMESSLTDKLAVPGPAATPSKRKRVLIIAYAFSPALGSEYRAAWQFVSQLLTVHDVTVMFGDSDGIMGGFDHFDRHAATHALHFTAAKVPATPLQQRLARIMLRMPWALFFAPLLRSWHVRAFRYARDLHAQHPFDVVHQLGPIGFRNPGYAWKLGCHSYWGPVGGAQLIDTKMIRNKWSAYYLEAVFRNLSVGIQAHSGYIGKAARGFDRVSFATFETANYFARHFGRSGPVISEQGLSIENLRSHAAGDDAQPLRVVWAGTLTPRKNIAALLDIVGAAPADIRFDFIGDGPLSATVTAFAATHPNLKVHGRLPRADVLEILAASDVILLTSLSEGNPSILFEGLENGCIPIAPAINGFVSTLNDNVAFLIPQGDPDKAVAAAVAALVALGAPRTRDRYRTALADHLPSLSWERLGASHEAQYD